MKKANKETIKLLNRQSVLNIIRKHKEISRTDLGDKTKLSPTTISAITTDLVGLNLVREIRIAESSGGRPPVMFGINPGAAFCITIRITTKGALVAIVNTKFEIIFRKQIAYSIHSEKELKEVLKTCITYALDSYEEDINLIEGVAVSIPGLIDYDNNTVIFCSSLNIENFNLQEAINHLMPGNKKAYIFKDADALLLGEYYFGLDSNYQDVMYILVEEGVGMSYIHEGELFRLPKGGLELGHMVIDPNGDICKCGNRGCLGAMVSGEPAIKRLEELLSQGATSCIKEVSGLRYDEIIEFARQGDQVCQKILEEQFFLLGIGISNMVNIFNPQLIILGGAISNCGDEVEKQIMQVISSKALKTFSQDIQVHISKLGRDSSLIGMSKTVFEASTFKIIST